MSKGAPIPILALEPSSELRFKGPFTQVVTAELTLKNLTAKRICFKVKTTAPKQYCVRPNGGFIEKSKSVKVQVILQPFNYDPNEKNRHKFLVQSMVCPDGPATDNHELMWKDAAPDQIVDSKLRCVFELPNDGKNPASSTPRPTTPTKMVDGNRQTTSSDGRRHRDTSCNRQKDHQRTDLLSGGSRFPQISSLLALFIAIIAVLAGIAIGKFLL